MAIGSATSGPKLAFGGLATGLDTNALLEALMGAERRPLQLLQQRRSDLDRERSLVRDLNTKLLALREAAAALDNRSSTLAGAASSEEFLAWSTSSSDDGVIVAKADGSAVAGSYDVRVEQLARAGRRISAEFTARNTTIASAGQTFTVSAGTGPDIAITVGAGGATLDDLRTLVNTDAGNAGRVRAEVLYDGARYRLVVSATKTGAANDVNITTNITAEGGGAFVDATKTQAGLDSRIQVLGVTVTRASNEVADALPGVTFQLKGTSDLGIPTDSEQITISRDDAKIAQKLESLVSAYNAVRDFLRGQSGGADGKGGGPLSGDSLLQNVDRLVKNALGGRYVLPGVTFTSLGEVGVSFDSQSRLSLDRDKLTKALDTDVTSVRTLLSGSGSADGAFSALARSLDPLTRSGDGTLATRVQSYDRNVRSFDDQLRRLELRLADRETSLRRRFTALESLVSTLQAQANYLSSASR